MVLGMHRSGTSVTAKILHDMGLSAGKCFLQADFANPVGYYENMELVLINMALLDFYHWRWDTLKPNTCLCKFENVPITISRRAKLLLEQLADSHHSIMIKDPRFNLVFPFWADLLRVMNFSIKIIYVYRKPESVIASLVDRDHITAFHSGMLGLKHHYDSLNHIKHFHVLFLNYERLIDYPELTVKSIIEFVNPEDHDVKPTLLSCIYRQLSHHNHDEILEPAWIKIYYEKIFTMLEKLRTGIITPADQEVEHGLKKIEAWFPFWEESDFLHQQYDHLRQLFLKVNLTSQAELVNQKFKWLFPRDPNFPVIRTDENELLDQFCRTTIHP